jgi:Na+:H+ antiporter, NhaA family
MRNLHLLREFSVPLVVGVCFALTWANLAPEQYHAFLHIPLIAGLPFHFITNDLFMTLFFGTAAVALPFMGSDSSAPPPFQGAG